jgi:hypothetical protein
MQKQPSEDEVLGHALDLAWSLWSELGVSGWNRRHQGRAIDLEPLILHTSWLGRYDRRLWGESIDWCITNSSLVSSVRLKKLLRSSSERIREAFGGFSATVKRHAHVQWPGDGEASPLQPSGKSSMAELERASLMQLRLRAAFGVSARAEILHWMLSEPTRQWSIAELVDRSMYGKANVNDTTDLMRRAGLVSYDRRGNARLFRLTAAPQLAAVLGELPTTYPRWPAVFAIIETLVDYRMRAHLSAGSTLSDVAAAMAEVNDLVDAASLIRRLPAESPADLAPRFDRWAVETLASWAAPSAADEAEQVYSIQRLELPPGAWMGVVITPGEGVTPLRMPEREGRDEKHSRSDTIMSDDSVGAPKVAHEMMRLAEARVGEDIGGYWGGGTGAADLGINQLVAREFADERLRPMRNGSAASWSESFVREWRMDRLARHQPMLSARGPRDERAH